MTLAATLAIGLLGCGGGGSGGSGGGKPATLPAGKALVVKADEYRFSPANVVAKPRGPLTIELRNDGAQAHDLHVQTTDGDDRGGTPVFGPGQTQKTIVRLAPGEYEFICTVGDHEAQGMKGTLTIQ